MVTALALLLVTVTVCAALVPPLTPLKVRLVLLREIGVVGPPVAADVSFTTSGVASGALAVIIIAPSSFADVGCTCTLTVQLAPPASGAVRQVPVLIV
jgi:hypothetical protein